jgi:hypothetical protein
MVALTSKNTVTVMVCFVTLKDEVVNQIISYLLGGDKGKSN